MIELKTSGNLVNAETFAENFPEFRIVSLQRISEGLNSQAYHLESQDKKHYLAKFYFRHPSDSRDRLGTEFLSLSALWEHGIRCIARPLAIHKSLGCAIYEYIEGEKIISRELTTEDIDQSVRFLERLKIFASKVPAIAFPPASEAYFSFQDIVDNMQWRLKRLETPAGQHEPLRIFLENDFKPFLKILVQWYKKESPLASDTPISQEEKTLSPSDFGFHNALKKKDGHIVFFDFEYFGWDDPAKMISDFLLHPAMSLSKAMKERFVSELASSSVFPEREEMLQRVRRLYPFFGLKWCLIFLNEFILDDLQRRKFAQKPLSHKKDIEQEQLLKSKNAFALVRGTYQNFPFDYVIR